MQVELFKKMSTYKNRDGEEKIATNFYIKCGNELVPIEVKYFEAKDGGNDPNYRARKYLLSATAEELPEKKKKASLHKICPHCHNNMRVDDSDLDQSGQGNVWFVCDKCGTSVVTSTDGTPDEVTLPDEQNEDVPF